jgi:hypothetical protein
MRFEHAMQLASERLPNRAALKEAAKHVTRPEARRAIYDFLREVAESDEGHGRRGEATPLAGLLVGPRLKRS